MSVDPYIITGIGLLIISVAYFIRHIEKITTCCFSIKIRMSPRENNDIERAQPIAILT